MPDAVDQQGRTPGEGTIAQWLAPLAAAARVAGPPLLFGVRLWAAVCLALYVAFWLQLDEPFWAGTSAAIMSQPQLGASLRKGWFRMVGTMIGAIAIVVLAACFPQDRFLFLLGLTLWMSACVLCASLLHNFAGYAAALAGYTAAIVASDTLGATGGANGEVFMLALTRATETCIGIVSAGIVFSGTSIRASRSQLAALFAELIAGIAAGATNILASAGPRFPDTRPLRREYIRRVVALDPVIDQTVGESSQVRYHAAIVQRAVDGLFAALASWRGAANHLVRLPREAMRQQAAIILQNLPQELRSLAQEARPARWLDGAAASRRLCETTARQLIDLPAGTPSLRLLADETAKMLAGLSQALIGVALLVGDRVERVPRGRGGVRLQVADWLPPLVNAGRAFLTIGALSVFWIVAAWPSGAQAIAFAAISVSLFASRGDQAYASALSFALGSAIAAVAAAIMAFAVLPNFDTFVGFSLAIGLWLVPAGAVAQRWRKIIFTYMAAYFVPLLAPDNVMSYDTVRFYNTALAVIAGTTVAAASYLLLPPISPAVRIERLLALTLHDLRAVAATAVPPSRDDWEARMYTRLAAVPDPAEPLQRAQLMAALSIGNEIIDLHRAAPRLGINAELGAAFASLAQGNSAAAGALLAELDDRLASFAESEADASLVLRARSRLLVIGDALAQHSAWLDSGAVP
jgi:uncharacterized membrane protein YccC